MNRNWRVAWHLYRKYQAIRMSLQNNQYFLYVVPKKQQKYQETRLQHVYYIIDYYSWYLLRLWRYRKYTRYVLAWLHGIIHRTLLIRIPVHLLGLTNGLEYPLKFSISRNLEQSESFWIPISVKTYDDIEIKKIVIFKKRSFGTFHNSNLNCIVHFTF